MKKTIRISVNILLIFLNLSAGSAATSATTTTTTTTHTIRRLGSGAGGQRGAGTLNIQSTNDEGRRTTADFSSSSPSSQPSNSATPSSSNSQAPSAQPTTKPTNHPTLSPSTSPSASPSAAPTLSPTKVPTVHPSGMPSDFPSQVPSMVPSTHPSASPTASPTGMPSLMPSDLPSMVPTSMPSAAPTNRPTDAPSPYPSDFPSMTPTSPLIVEVTTNSAGGEEEGGGGHQSNSVRYNKQSCATTSVLDPEPQIEEGMHAMIVYYSYSLRVQDGNDPVVTMGLIEDYLVQVIRRLLCVTGNPQVVSPHDVVFSASPADLNYQACSPAADDCTLVEGGLTVWLKSANANTIGAGGTITSVAAVVQCEIVQQIQSLADSGAITSLPGVYWARLESISSCQDGNGGPTYGWQVSYMVASAGAFLILSTGLVLRRQYCASSSSTKSATAVALEKRFETNRGGVQRVDPNAVLNLAVTEDLTMYSRGDSVVRRSQSLFSGSRDQDDSRYCCHQKGSFESAQSSSGCSSSQYSDATVLEDSYDSYQDTFEDNYSYAPSKYTNDNNKNSIRERSNGGTNETIVLDSKLFSLSMKTIPEAGSFTNSSYAEDEEEGWETIALDGH